MEIQGHIQNGAAVPDDLTSLPEGAQVKIVVTGPCVTPPSQLMNDEDLARYRLALAEIDVFFNENPGDDFSGADHDQVLYGRDE